VILYADTVTASIKAALEETDRRRAKQWLTIRSTASRRSREARHPRHGHPRRRSGADEALAGKEELAGYLPENRKDVPKVIAELEAEMRAKAEELDFEGAAMLRDKVQAIRTRPGDHAQAAEALKQEARAAQACRRAPPTEAARRSNGRPGQRR